MTEEIKYRLADCTLVEALVNNWVAWSYVISPAAASLHLLHYQLKTMQDYLRDPELHVRACGNPELTGGPFINIPAERASEVRELLAQTEQRQGANLEFARAITEFQNLLVAEAGGQSLEPFYERLPEALRGYVELLYDYYSRPLVRFVEGLLYQSDYYNQNLQSLRISQLVNDNARAFFLSTPRLPQPGQIDWKVPFADPPVDELFKLDIAPQPLCKIRELLGLNGSDEQTLLSFLTAQSSGPPERWLGSGVRLRYFGHACVLVEWNGVSILTDPFIGIMPLEGGIERLSFRDLPPEIDYVLITHNHSDHFVLETLLRLRHRIGSLVVPKSYGLLYGDISLKLMAQSLGFKRVVELETMESIALPEGEIIAIPFFGEHGDLAHGKSGFVVRAGHERIMFGADSNCLDRRVYENVRRHLGPIETVFLGTECVGAPLTWSYGPLFPVPPRRSHVQSRRQHGCDAQAALKILETVGARRFYNYGMGLEPWLEQILALGLSDDSLQIRESDALLAKARGRGLLVAERLYGCRDIYLEPETVSRRTPKLSGGTNESVAEDSSRNFKLEDELEDATLSDAQQQFWRLSKTFDGGFPCNVAASLKITGPLRAEHLKSALEDVWNRHPVLHSRFVEAGGKLTKVFEREATPHWQLVDLESLPESEREAEASTLVQDEAVRPFALEHELLFRTILVRLTPQEHVLLLTLHRMICDGPSLRVLGRQLASAYEAFSTGRQPAPVHAAMQDTDSSWQRRPQLDGEGFGKQLAYWNQQLDGLVSSLDLPVRRARPLRRDVQKRALESLIVPAGLSENLQELSERHNCSLETILVAAFEAFLHRLTGQDQLSIGTLVANRSLPGTEESVGPLANILVLRTDLSGDPDFLTLLARVRQVIATASAHQDVLFEQLAASFRRAPDSEKTALFQAGFIFDCALMPPLARGGLTWNLREIERGMPGHDLSLFMHMEGSQLDAALEYDAELFDAAAIRTMLEQLVNLLHGVARNEKCPLAELPLNEMASESYLNGSPGALATNDAEDQFIF
jgi:L-ascorbate metabolism protein UlaG (beta-lactamase superfamily)/NRPS condensation-like uncharacterized protein